MKAFVLENDEHKVIEIKDPIASTGEVVVAIKVAGLNRRDTYIKARRKDNNKEAVIIGSDGAGVVEKVGDGVTRFKVGDEVIINPSLNWFELTDAPPLDFDILGHPTDGTFAEKIVISEEQLEKKPAHLNWEEAGVLTLAALTGYRAIVTKGQIKAGETVFIPGAGSGVATYLIQFAKNIGAKVIISSRSAQKQNKAKKLGADIVLDTNSDWEKQLEGETIDLVIDSVGGETFKRSLQILKKGGRIVTFGSTTEDDISFNLREFFYGQYKLFGSTMGSREELRELLQHLEVYNMHPVVDRVFSLAEAKEAMNYLQNGYQFGKVAIHIND
ncbi:zinc-binding dehydrogenase [Oceanobacillus sp. Castelsardo]|uniref:zinc-binding dehydrogenase n=1 Tax=Oceanobacillus sp. Castelsardo TaxID=1851204 RepID=UPI000839496C|nr:zinc-binding dehydrogenase [Oceanobacillus sp. Castelsardo]